MALPNPFNSVETLARFTSFQQGTTTGAESVQAGAFPFSAFVDALQCARNEIFARCGHRQNDGYEEWRRAQLTEAELWLATARLYPKFGERIAIAFPESNLAAVGPVSIGADTPSPVEKGVHWTEFMYQKIRAVGLELMLGQGETWGMAVGSEPERERFGCLGSNAYFGRGCQCH